MHVPEDMIIKAKGWYYKFNGGSERMTIKDGTGYWVIYCRGNHSIPRRDKFRVRLPKEN